MDSPPFFIVGSARSGTTLLRLIFNAHPDVAVPPESRFVVSMSSENGTVSPESFLAQLAAHKRFQAWELPIEEVRKELGEAPLPLAAAIAGAYRAYARVRGKSRWGDKTPRYVESIPLISGLFPDARFIHIVRDGRNVALSYADVPFGPETVGKAAALWGGRVRAGMRDGRALGPDRYLEIRYEALVENAEAEIKALCDFVELDYDPVMLDYTERSRSDVLPRAKSYNPNVTKPPTANVRSWAEVMPTRQVAIFEAVAGDVLSEFGYPRHHERPGPLTRARAILSRLGIGGRLATSRPKG